MERGASVNFLKATNGLVPMDEQASEWLRKKKQGAVIEVEAKEIRNGAFFRKWWALVQLGYDYWSHDAKTEHNGVPILPNFDRFRKDVTISAGFYYPVVNIKGEVRLEPESLKWASMTEERFDQLYSATIQVMLDKVFNGVNCAKWSEEELRGVVDQIQGFA